MDQKELFANYEIDNSHWKKFVFKLLGASLIFHIIIFLFLIYVPAVRDAFYIALLFSDAPTGWVNKDYNKTQIEEGETASIINLPPADQLQYPTGYFNLANGDAPPPDMVAMTTPYAAPDAISTESGTIPGFPGYTINQPTTTPTPFPIPSPVAGFPPINTPNSSSRGGGLPKLRKVSRGAKLPEFSGATSENNGGISGIPQPTPTPLPEPKSGATASASPSPAPAPKDSLNPKPLEDLAARTIKQINDKEIDLNKLVNVTIKGVLDDKGKLVAKQTTYTNNGGDEKLASMAVELIAAMNDSNMLMYVKDLSGGSTKRDVVFNISKDEKEVKFQVVSDIGNSKEAGKIQSTLSLGISLILLAKNGTEEGDLLKGIKIETDKNQVVINWQMDASTAMKKIQNKLDKIAAEQKAKPTSVIPANPNAQAAVK
ncbi:MAG: hypothetical protein ABI954_00185 [Pyrinomonadaceae bacterium]